MKYHAVDGMASTIDGRKADEPGFQSVNLSFRMANGDWVHVDLPWDAAERVSRQIDLLVKAKAEREIRRG